MTGCPWYIPDRVCNIAVEEGKKEARNIVMAHNVAGHLIVAAFLIWLVIE